MLERTPQPGQIWRHYKGTEYAILLVTQEPINKEDIVCLSKLESIKHSETSHECFLTYEDGVAGLIYAHDVYTSAPFDEPYVIYQRTDITFPQVWARPLYLFLGVISRPYIENVVSVNCYRFDRIS